MFKMFKLIGVLMLLTSSVVVNAQDFFTVKTCKTCVSTSEFEEIAKKVMYGDVFVVNPTSKKVVKFNVKTAFLWPDYTQRTNAQFITLSSDEVSQINADFQAIDILKIDIQNIDLSSVTNTNNYTNGCGAENSWSSSVIPNFPFKQACDNHDLCYASNAPKGQCDGIFLQDMKNTALLLGIQFRNNHTTPLILDELLVVVIESTANVFHAAVVWSETARMAYCESTGNTGAAICDPLWGTPEFANYFSYNGTFDYNVSVPSTNSGGGNHPRIVSCELWQFPNGNGGYYRVYRNCN